MPRLSPSGVVLEVRKLVPFAVGELRTQQKKISYSYRDLFARRCTPAGCSKEGEIILLLKKSKDKHFFTRNTAKKIEGVERAAGNFNEAYKLRRDHRVYPDDAHLFMAFALKKAVEDLNTFTNQMRTEG